MQMAASSLRNSVTILVACIVAFILGYLYVQTFAVGWRAIFLIHAAVLFFLGCALFIRNLRSFLLFIMIFAIPLQYGYHVIYQPMLDVQTSPFSSGVRIDVVDAVLWLLYMYWGFRLAQQRLGHTGITLGHSLGKLFLIWIVYVAIAGVLRSEHLNYTLFEIVTLFQGFMLFFYLINNLSSERDLRVVLYALFANTVAHALYIIMQSVTGFNYTVHGEASTHFVEQEGFRPAGFAGSWDAAAAMMHLVLPVLFAYYFIAKNRAWHRAALMGIGIVLLGLLLTKVRGAWIATLVSAITVVAVSYLRGWISSTQTFKVAAGGIAVLVLAAPFVVERLITGAWGEDRLPLIYTAINMFKANWLLGVGPNNYFFHIEQYLPISLRHTWEAGVHNEYLMWAAETGLPGFLLYYSLLFVMLKKLWKLTASPDPWIYLASVGFFGAMVGSLPYRMTSPYFFLEVYSESCVVLAVTCVLQTLEKKRLAEVRASLQDTQRTI
ncbi:MAG: O-antigen ligase family protein [Desulfomonilaceae bacterium]